jgi:hypothetical protein
MRILSWDVGIKNLAYCLIDITDTIQIIDWGIINLLEEKEHKCFGFINSDNNNAPCIKTPRYEYLNGEDKYHFCTLHKRQFEKIETNTIDIQDYKGDEVCGIIKSNKNPCEKPAKFKINENIKSTYCCKLHCNSFNKKNNIIKKIVPQNASKAPIEIIKYNLVTALDKKKFNNIDYVLIENQPSMKNPKMKGVADTLYSWFLIRGLIDKDINELKHIFYLSPSNKLKIDDVDINKEINAMQDPSKKYKFTKQTAIIYTKKILNQNKEEEWKKYLEKSNKKDDLCDSYLQGLYFIKNTNKFI